MTNKNQESVLHVTCVKVIDDSFEACFPFSALK